MTQDESLLIEEELDELELWYFEVRNISEQKTGEEIVWEVLSVPSIMNVSLPPSSVLEFVRFFHSHSTNAHSSNSPLQDQNTSSDTTPFIPPPPVGRLLASRACRGAVMFGDPLTLPQATLLWEDVKKCAFPFYCAHGRNSMAVVGDLSVLHNISR